MTEQEWMLTSLLECRRVDLYAERQSLTPSQEMRYASMQRRRKEGEPLQYILGYCDFLGVRIGVDLRVLIPRSETEILVETALERIKIFPPTPATTDVGADAPLRVLDLGTGSGNIAIALAQHLKYASVTAVDISFDALALARHNAASQGVEHKINFIQADMTVFLEEGISVEKQFDVMISNPPYIPTSQLEGLPRDVRQEPRIALDGGKDGLRFIRGLIACAHRHLREGGFLALEIGDGQREAVEEIFAQHPSYRNIRFYKDYVQTDRIVYAEKTFETEN